MNKNERSIESYQAELGLVKGELFRRKIEDDIQEKLIKTVRNSCIALKVGKYTIPTVRTNLGRKPESAVLLFGDSHIGEIIDPVALMGVNSYDFNTFIYRLQLLVDTIYHLKTNMLSGYEFDELVIICLGDMVSGHIHEELEATGDRTILEWVISGAYIISQAIADLSSMFPEIRIIGLNGNHGRLHKKKRFKNPRVNWDTILYEALASYCVGLKNVKMTIPRSFMSFINIKKYSVLATHGDSLKCGNAPMPWYSMDRNESRLARALPVKHDYYIIGHFHNAASIGSGNGKIMVNGSFCGPNEFALTALGKAEPASQTFFGMHEDIGITFSYDLLLNRYLKMPIRYKVDLDKSVAEQLGKE